MKKNNKKTTETKSVKSDVTTTEIVEVKEVTNISKKHYPKMNEISYDLDAPLTKRQQVALIMITLKTFDMDISEAYKMADEFLAYNK